LAIWSAEAIADLDAIWNYYAHAAAHRAADGLVRKISDVVTAIETHPLAGRSRDELRPGIRSIAASPYVAFYRMTNDHLESSEILDGRRDIVEIFC
jgi:toxin ParE1/3/4